MIGVSSESASSAVQFLQRMAARGIADPLRRVGLDRAAVRPALERTRPLTAEEMRRAAANAHPKARVGRRGLPGYVVDAMYADYLRLHSLSRVAKLYHRTRQNIWDIFRSHGKALFARTFAEKVIWRGRAFTPGKDGYLRATLGDREPLHHAMWRATHGEIPEGFQVTFRNANRLDFRDENLACMPIAEVTRLHSTGHNQFTRRRDRRSAA